MAEINAGKRVGAFLNASDTEVRVLGYGVHEGEFIVPKEINESLHATSTPSPRIKLDNGDVVWGCECYWGTEQKVLDYIERNKLKVIDASIKDFRS